MLKWFYKWLGSKIQDSQYADEDAVPELIGSNKAMRGKQRSTLVREGEEFSSEPIQFKMYKANGGWAIEFRQYDNNRDRLETALYVINSEEELGKHLSQIITMEALKR